MIFISNHIISGKLSILTKKAYASTKLAEARMSSVIGTPQPLNRQGGA